jgi:hypothetical protein
MSASKLAGILLTAALPAIWTAGHLCAASGAERPADRESVLANLLPSQTFAALGCDDLGGFLDRLRETSLGKAWNLPESRPLSQALETLAGSCLGNPENTSLDSILPHLEGQWLLALAPPGVQTIPAPKHPTLILLVRKPLRSDSFARFVERTILVRWPDLARTYQREDDLFLFCPDTALREDLRRQYRFASSPARNAPLAQSWDPDAAFNLWLSPQPAILQAAKSIDISRPNTRIRDWVELLGLNTLANVHAAVRPDGNGFRSSVDFDFVDFVAAPAGLFSETPVLIEADIAPEDSAIFFSAAFRDPISLWDKLSRGAPRLYLEDVQGLPLPPSPPWMDEGLALLSGQAAASVSFPRNAPPEAAVWLGVEDAEKARTFLDENLAEIAKPVGIVSSGFRDGRPYDTLHARDIPVSLTFSLAKGCLGISTSLESLFSEKNLAETERYQKPAVNLNAGSPGAFFYFDAARFIPPLGAVALHAGAPGLSAQEVAVILASAPYREPIRQEVGPAAGVLKATGDSLRLEIYSEGCALSEAAMALPPIALAAAPNAIDIQTKSLVRAVETDLRILSGAIEQYQAASGAPPPIGKQGAFGTFGYPENLIPLTTPLAYIDALPADPFNSSPKKTYGYLPTPDGWIVFSPGPDGDFDIGLQIALEQRLDGLGAWLLGRTYDPTNGTVSGGDIWRSSMGQ